MKALTPTRRYCLPLLLLSFFLGQALYAAWDTGQTTDETFYNGSGYPMVRYNNYGFLGEHPPLIIQLGSLPLLFLQPSFPIKDPVYLEGPGREIDVSRTGAKFLYESGNDPQLILFLERIPIVLLGVILGFFLYRWGLTLYGPGGATVALMLYVFCPNILAHGSLFTTDSGVTVFYFLAVYSLWSFFRAPSTARAVGAGLLAGLAFLSKISGLILAPVMIVLFGFGLLGKERPNPSAFKVSPWFYALALFLLAMTVGSKAAMTVLGPLCLLGLSPSSIPYLKRQRWGKRIGYSLVGIGWGIAFIYALRLFEKYELLVAVILFFWVVAALASSLFLKRIPFPGEGDFVLRCFLLVSFVAAVTVIIGYTDFFHSAIRFKPFNHYIRTFNIAVSHARSAHTHCVEGSFVTCDWRYFPTLMAVKTPSVTLFLALAGFLALWRLPLVRLDRAHLWIPPLFFLLAAAFLNRINIGLRHILPVYPFLFLAAGAVVPFLKANASPVLRKSGLWLLLVFLILSAGRTLQTMPHYLSYFSEWVGDIERGAMLVSDSNIDWGQNNKRLVDLIKEKGIPHVKIDSSMGNKDLYDFYGISWETVETSKLVKPPPGYYAIGIEKMRPHFGSGASWFARHRPKFKAGETFYVFEVPQ